jgi:hypothetical protein
MRFRGNVHASALPRIAASCIDGSPSILGAAETRAHAILSTR